MKKTTGGVIVTKEEIQAWAEAPEQQELIQRWNKTRNARKTAEMVVGCGIMVLCFLAGLGVGALLTYWLMH